MLFKKILFLTGITSCFITNLISHEIHFGNATRNVAIGDRPIGAPKSDRHLLYEKMNDKAFFADMTIEQKAFYLSLLNKHTSHLEQKLDNYSFLQKLNRYGKGVGILAFGLAGLTFGIASLSSPELPGMTIVPGVAFVGYGVVRVNKAFNYKAIIESKIELNQQAKELIVH